MAQGLPAALRASKRFGDEAVLLPGQALMEFLTGEADPEAAMHRLERAYTIVYQDFTQARVGSRIAADYRTRRLRPPWADIHVAALARSRGTYVVTGDAEGFRALGCAVWDYRVEASPPSSAS